MLQSNAILTSLSESDAAALRSHLKATYLEQKTVLFEAGGTIRAVTSRRRLSFLSSSRLQAAR